MIIVDGPVLSATIDPQRGAKITSLRDARGVEWLTQAPAIAPRGTRFIDAEMAGWDECAPTIVGCRVAGRDLPDHGDLWDAPFRVEQDGRTVTAVGRSLNYTFRRRITATPTGLRIEYEAVALDGPIPFLYAAHPQFVAPPGTRVHVPRLRGVVDVLDPTLPQRSWTSHLATIDTVPSGDSRKLYGHPDTAISSASIIHPDGGSLGMRWSSACAYVGLWFDNRAYSREPVIAIEPSTAYFDALDIAISLDRAPYLTPMHPLVWRIELTSPAMTERAVSRTAP